MSDDAACEACIRRSWLLARLASRLDRVRARIQPALELPDDELLDAVAGKQRPAIARELASLDAASARREAAAAGLELLCRCRPEYPARLLALASPPAVLHLAGGRARFLDLLDRDPVAIVGSRRPSPYGAEMAAALGRSLGAAGIPVVSGMALGIDSAAHAGALTGSGATLAVLPGSADRPYPAGKRALHRKIVASGVALSELPPGAGIWRWQFLARNRVIAALAAATVVVEARSSSGALVTAESALGLDRPVGAVPGRVTTPQAEGPNELLAHGAFVVRGAQDVLDRLFGEGRRSAADHRPPLEPDLRRVLRAVAEGNDTAGALERVGIGLEQALSALASLELAGHVRRGPGGRFSVIP